MSTDFTAQDAQNIVLLAQNSPLKNLQEAKNVSELLARFAQWANTHFSSGAAAADQAPSIPIAPAAPTAVTPSSTARAVREAINASKTVVPVENQPAKRVLPARVAARVKRS